MARVLAIDDDDGTRRMLFEALTRAGHEVIAAPDGRAGVARYWESCAEIPTAMAAALEEAEQNSDPTPA